MLSVRGTHVLLEVFKLRLQHQRLRLARLSYGCTPTNAQSRILHLLTINWKLQHISSRVKSRTNRERIVFVITNAKSDPFNRFYCKHLQAMLIVAQRSQRTTEQQTGHKIVVDVMYKSLASKGLSSKPVPTKHSCGSSLKWGPEYTPPNTRILMVETPKRYP